MLQRRLIFGPVMIGLLAAILYLDSTFERIVLAGTFWQLLFLGREALPPGILMFLVLLGIICLAANELCGIFRAKQIKVEPWVVSTAGISGFACVYLSVNHDSPHHMPACIASAAVMIAMLSLAAHCRRRQTQGAIATISATILSFIYLGLLPGLLMAIRIHHGVWMIAAILGITKTCDIGAYFTGQAIGHRKLVPWLSPGKTWEGLIGGLLLSALLALGLAVITNHNGNGAVCWPLIWAGIGGLVLGGVGQLGDLLVSLLKRDAGIKDSGSSIPGFGGILDVVDSPLLVAPVAYWLLWAIK